MFSGGETDDRVIIKIFLTSYSSLNKKKKCNKLHARNSCMSQHFLAVWGGRGRDLGTQLYFVGFNTCSTRQCFGSPTAVSLEVQLQMEHSWCFHKVQFVVIPPGLYSCNHTVSTECTKNLNT